MRPDQRNPVDNQTWNRMNKWETLVDERIRRIIGDGDMSWHPGAGQPLALDDMDEVPPDERMAYKILKDNDSVPVWISLAATLREKQSKIMTRAQHYAVAYLRRTREALLAGSFVQERQAHDRWTEASNRLQVDIERYNSELLNYNLQIPSHIQQMVPLNAKAILESALREAEHHT